MTKLQGDNSSRQLLVYGTLIAVALIALAVFAWRGRTNTSGLAQFDLRDQPIIGNKDAPVTIVVLSDFKCPNCKMFEENALPELEKKYIDTGKAKLAFLSYPFLAAAMRLPIDDSQLAAEAVECAYVQGGSQAYLAMQQLIFRAQGPEQAVWATPTLLKDLAGSVDGLNLDKFNTCLDRNETLEAVKADKAQATKFRVVGTPAVYVNGKLIVNYDPATIGAAIDAAMK